MRILSQKNKKKLSYFLVLFLLGSLLILGSNCLADHQNTNNLRILKVPESFLSEKESLVTEKKAEKKTFEQMGVKVPKILLPKDINTETWCTIACDQYTQNQEYWDDVEKIVGNDPSTFRITYPEIYLNATDKKERIKRIQKLMLDYKENVFETEQEEMIYLERTTNFGRMRKGLILAVDLEAYEYKPQAKSLIRPTEATIEDRLPPRIEIREGAAVEVPHIMLLINDKDKQFIEGIGKRVSSGKTIYSGDLMKNGGSIKGWKINSEEDLEYLRATLQKIYEQSSNSENIFLLAVGDGNHSLATAKKILELYKKKHKDFQNAKIRYALVEVCNIYDDGLNFEPIHRVIFNLDPEFLINNITAELKGNITDVESKEELVEAVSQCTNCFGFAHKINETETKYTLLTADMKYLAVIALQPALDKILADKTQAKIDFLHGTEELFRVLSKNDTTSIMLPNISKDGFFDSIKEKGSLPRKSFSIGEADEKRFYMESRDIQMGSCFIFTNLKLLFLIILISFL